MQSFYEEQMRKPRNKEILLKSKNYEDFCNQVSAMNYEKTKGGWIEGLYETIKVHPDRYLAKSLHFPQFTKLSEIVEDVIFVPQGKAPEGYYYLSTLRTPFTSLDNIGGLRGYSENGVKRIYGNYKTYHTYIKPKKEIAKFFNESLIEGLGAFEMVDRGDDAFLLIANSKTHIGSWWCSLLIGEENANHELLYDDATKQIIKENEELEKKAWG